jgi:hypothetical protein
MVKVNVFRELGMQAWRGVDGCMMEDFRSGSTVRMTEDKVVAEGAWRTTLRQQRNCRMEREWLGILGAECPTQSETELVSSADSRHRR